MTFSRKTFLRGMGLGLAGLGSGVLHGTAETAGEGGLDLPDISAGEETYWRAVQAMYDIDPGLRYFNTGGLGPTSRVVRERTVRESAGLERRVETGHHLLDAARTEVAAFMGCGPAELAFVRNTTEANGIVADGLSLQTGDEVIFESHAHPGGSFPWLLQAKRSGVAVRLFEPDSASVLGNVERIEALLTRRTRVVQVSHFTAPTGVRMPVEAIAAMCRKRGIWFHVDGAQSAGMIPINFAVMGCDSYATSGHKWLGAPRESGLLIVRQDRVEELTPPLVGAYSGDVERLPGEIVLTAGAGRFEYGTRDVARIVGVVEATRWQLRIGRDRIARQGAQLVRRLRDGLTQLPDIEVLTPVDSNLSGSMLTFRTPRMGYSQLFSALWGQHQLRCRPVSEQGLDAVRVSCHLCTTKDDVDHLLSALTTVLHSA